MGNTASEHSEHHDEEEDLDPFDGIETLGYRVLGVQPNSPASAAGLVSFLDFLVGANERMLLGSGEGLEPGDEYDDVDLPAMLAEFKGQEMELLVWNIKSQEARLVKLTPADDWGGAGLLGVTIRLDNYAGAEDRLVRVLTVEANSPAAVAGLVPEKDFLLGTTHQTLESVSQLATVLQQHEDRVVELYVYNTDSDLVRVVALMPTLSWGGGGLLGATVGTGYLHRLPHASRSTEGASVERKVRYVPAAPPPAPTSGNRSPASDAAKRGNGPASSSGGGSSNGSQTGATEQRAVLELEPQLEMEPSEEGGSEGRDDDDLVVEQHLRAQAQRSSSRSSSSSGGGGRNGFHAGSSGNDKAPKQPQKQPSIVTLTSSTEKEVAATTAATASVSYSHHSDGSVVGSNTTTTTTAAAATADHHPPSSEPLPSQTQLEVDESKAVKETARAFSILSPKDSTASEPAAAPVPAPLPAATSAPPAPAPPAAAAANNNAASLVFSQPPVQTDAAAATTTSTNTSYAAPSAAAAIGGVLPPPPVMHYYSPPK